MVQLRWKVLHCLPCDGVDLMRVSFAWSYTHSFYRCPRPLPQFIGREGLPHGDEGGGQCTAVGLSMDSVHGRKLLPLGRKSHRPSSTMDWRLERIVGNLTVTFAWSVLANGPLITRIAILVACFAWCCFVDQILSPKRQLRCRSHYA